MNRKQHNRLLAIGSVQLEECNESDNLAFLLACYFEAHMERPEDDEDNEDPETNLTPWVEARVNKAIERIIEWVEANDKGYLTVDGQKHEVVEDLGFQNGYHAKELKVGPIRRIAIKSGRHWRWWTTKDRLGRP